MKPSWYRVVVVGVAALMFPVLAWAQPAPEVGVVTTIQGQATVAHTASTAPLPLKFRDSIFEKDRINTGEKSIVKVLMGGRAIVTVRELSVLTITEEVGRTVVNLESGKIAVGVAKQRMKPGETLEVHTPNAVAAVRGTVFVVEVTRQGAQAGGGNLAANTQVTTVQGSVQVGAIGGNPANTALVNAFQSVGVQGLNLTQVQNMTQQQMNQLVGTFIANKQFGAHQAAWSSMSDKEKGKVVALAAALVPAEDPKAGANGNTFNQAQVLPPTTTLPTPPPPAPPKTIFINGGFETAIFPPGWNLTGSGYVIGSFGQFTAPNCQFMGFISTGPGSQADPTGRFTQSSTLSQSFSVTGGTLYTVKATYNFVSNEYPYWVNLYGGNSPFNDAMEIRIKGPGGQTTQLSQLQVNGAFTPSQVSHQNVSVAGFTAGGDCVTCGWGYTGFKVVSFSWLAPSSGEASLLLEVGDV